LQKVEEQDNTPKLENYLLFGVPNCFLVCKSTKNLPPKKFDTFALGKKFNVMICFLV